MSDRSRERDTLTGPRKEGDQWVGLAWMGSVCEEALGAGGPNAGPDGGGPRATGWGDDSRGLTRPGRRVLKGH